ncbi:hypothetical protein GCM10023322_63140 [Rugosimonospora acidiphila]|uniref:Rv2525c-like glycoside hydrolase-like domain-containing protein n=1 Tax=Rugosimonospora acidiphila TaxID=556531 RepID=A0ABP9SIF0_9ACTN
MTRLGLDYAWEHPGPAAIRSAGYTFVVRYLGGSASKDLTRAEADTLIAAGLDIVCNWEASASAALNGHAQGVADARAALAQATAAGMPPSRPIYFSVDIDTNTTQYSAIDGYFQGVISVLGLARTGVYGEYDLVAHCVAVHEVTWVWQTYAWSASRWYPGAQLRQVQNGITVGGADVDKDQAMAEDFGQWGQEAIDMGLRDDADGYALIERVYALTIGADNTPLGPTKGEIVWLSRTLKDIQAKVAADETRDAATLAAIQALTGGGTSVDTTAVVNAIDAAASRTNSTVADLQQQLADTQARLATALAPAGTTMAPAGTAMAPADTAPGGPS